MTGRAGRRGHRAVSLVLFTDRSEDENPKTVDLAAVMELLKVLSHTFLQKRIYTDLQNRPMAVVEQF